MDWTPRQWQQYDDAVHNAVRNHFGHQTQILTRASAPGLWNAGHELAEKAGIRCRMYAVESIFPHQPTTLAALLPNAAGGPMLAPKDGNIFFTKNFLRLGNISLHSPPEPWVKAVMAHEMGHIRQGLRDAVLCRQWPKLLPVGAVTGLWLYEKFLADKGESQQKLSKPEQAASFQAFADQAIADQEKTEQKALAGDIPAQVASTNAVDSGTLQLNKYLIAAVLGAGAGLLATRFHVGHREFDADRCAVELTRDPDAVIQIFPKMRAMMKAARQSLPTEIRKGTWKDMLLSELTHYHPSDHERIANIKQVAKEMGLECKTALPHPPQPTHAALLENKRLMESMVHAGLTPHL